MYVLPACLGGNVVAFLTVMRLGGCLFGDDVAELRVKVGPEVRAVFGLQIHGVVDHLSDGASGGLDVLAGVDTEKNRERSLWLQVSLGCLFGGSKVSVEVLRGKSRERFIRCPLRVLIEHVRRVRDGGEWAR